MQRKVSERLPRGRQGSEKALAWLGELGPTPPDQWQNGRGKAGERLVEKLQKGFLDVLATCTCGHTYMWPRTMPTGGAKGPERLAKSVRKANEEIAFYNFIVATASLTRPACK